MKPPKVEVCKQTLLILAYKHNLYNLFANIRFQTKIHPNCKPTLETAETEMIKRALLIHAKAKHVVESNPSASLSSFLVFQCPSWNFTKNLFIKHCILLLDLHHCFLCERINLVLILLIQNGHRVQQYESCFIRNTMN